ncbi:unnamed protein product, partial [Urochloa humidicola]
SPPPKPVTGEQRRGTTPRPRPLATDRSQSNESTTSEVGFGGSTDGRTKPPGQRRGEAQSATDGIRRPTGTQLRLLGSGARACWGTRPGGRRLQAHGSWGLRATVTWLLARGRGKPARHVRRRLLRGAPRDAALGPAAAAGMARSWVASSRPRAVLPLAGLFGTLPPLALSAPQSAHCGGGALKSGAKERDSALPSLDSVAARSDSAVSVSEWTAATSTGCGPGMPLPEDEGDEKSLTPFTGIPGTPACPWRQLPL